MAVVAVGSISMLLIVGASFWDMESILRLPRRPALARGWRWLRVRALGGVTTTLRRPLSYNCAMCQHSLDAGRPGGGAHPLLQPRVALPRERQVQERHRQVARAREHDLPLCRKTPFPVLPWKARPPPLSPPPSEPPMPVSSSSGLENPLPSPGLVDIHAQASMDTIQCPISQTGWLSS